MSPEDEELDLKSLRVACETLIANTADHREIALCRYDLSALHDPRKALALLSRAERAERMVEEMREVLQRARTWGIAGRAFDSGVSRALAEWVDGGCVDAPPPLPDYLTPKPLEAVISRPEPEEKP